MKKLVTALLSGALMLGAVPAAAYAEYDPSEQTAEIDGVTYTYTIEDSDPAGITIMKVSEVEGAFTLPAEIDGHRVIGIFDNAFLGQTKLEFIYLPDSLEYIGQSAFAGCTSMTQVVIPDNVTSLGYSSFMGCTKLFTVSVGEGVTEIPDECFFSCPSLKEVTLPSKLTKIGNEAFYGCPELDTLIPETVTSIGYSALGYTSASHSSYSTQVDDFIIGGRVGSAAETYAKEYGFDFLDPDNYLAGDVNKDGRVDAKDASSVLTEYSRASTGAELTFSRWQRLVGDMKPDNVIDANDASRILIEYSRLSTTSDSSL